MGSLEKRKELAKRLRGMAGETGRQLGWGQGRRSTFGPQEWADLLLEVCDLIEHGVRYEDVVQLDDEAPGFKVKKA